eukprot:g4945.t1
MAVVIVFVKVVAIFAQNVTWDAMESPGGFSYTCVSLSSDGTIVAIGEHINNNVRVYKHNGTNWNQMGRDIDGEADGDNSGISVSLSHDGTIVAIGAPRDMGNTGYVRVYKHNGTNWNQMGSDIDGEEAGGMFGYSVSLSHDGSSVAIGDFTNSDGMRGHLRGGHVRVYKHDGTSWNQMGGDIDGIKDDGMFGWSVSLSSDGTIVAGGTLMGGYVLVYKYDGTDWNQMGSDIDEAARDGDPTHVSLSFDGTIIAIGAPYTNSKAGQVHVYKHNGTNWNQMGSDIDGEATNDQSGRSVSLSSDGTVLAIGAPWTNSKAGQVRVYKHNGTNWNQMGSAMDGEATNDQSGRSVSLSSDGTVLALGSARNVRMFNRPDDDATTSTTEAGDASTTEDADTTETPTTTTNDVNIEGTIHVSISIDDCSDNDELAAIGDVLKNATSAATGIEEEYITSKSTTCDSGSRRRQLYSKSRRTLTSNETMTYVFAIVMTSGEASTANVTEETLLEKIVDIGSSTSDAANTFANTIEAAAASNPDMNSQSATSVLSSLRAYANAFLDSSSDDSNDNDVPIFGVVAAGIVAVAAIATALIAYQTSRCSRPSH